LRLSAPAHAKPPLAISLRCGCSSTLGLSVLHNHPPCASLSGDQTHTRTHTHTRLLSKAQKHTHALTHTHTHTHTRLLSKAQMPQNDKESCWPGLFKRVYTSLE